ncbi:protein-arginine deiminase type-2 isoform X2 [Osmerus mordax]|uniref:protein-arginine deiminase type-2 isoform X2 n=1 Tax=Osmerus mordax TaxID=8014 RepID=UPI00350F5309
MDRTQQQVQRSELPEVIQNAKIRVAEKYRPMHRTLRLDITKPNRAVHIAGTALKINLYMSAPPSSRFFSVKCSPQVQIRISPSPSDAGPTPLRSSSVLLFSMDSPSVAVNDSKLSVMYYGKNSEVLAKAVLHLTSVEIYLDVDADRDGEVERNNPNKGSWTWGPDGQGAILLVNCDSERTYGKRVDSEQKDVTRVSDLKDMSPMLLRIRGPPSLPEGYKLALHISQRDASSLRVFRTRSTEDVHRGLINLFYSSFVKDYPLVVGKEVLSQEVPYRGGNSESKFYVEGLRFPDSDFDGLVQINLSLLEPSSKGCPETPIFTDRVVFRVAPWIMTPNTLTPVEVFVCSTSDNAQFVKAVRRLVQDYGCKLKICSEFKNRGDRWMQDEMEFGYIDSPHQRFPVVLDSPRDRGLQDFPFDELLGPDFGYVSRLANSEEVTSLDSFGNLEVSPPVTVNGKEYPLGRIIIGVAFPTTTQGRNMTRVVQDFLWAQKVQEPIALYSDWLTVGHVDEFMTFVPAPDRKGFRLLLASPEAGYKVFRRLQIHGHGQAYMFDGLGEKHEIKVDDILADEKLQADNNFVQGCIDWNRDVLKRELGLEDDDIIDLPILFSVDEEDCRAAAFYPDMVNMLVLGRTLGVPKPFGPRVEGRCALEAEMIRLMEPLGLSCTFIDDFSSYHQLLGEVHCGSNVRREAFSFRWWHLQV